MVRKKAAKNGADLGFEEKLWLATDKLRGSMDASRAQVRRPGPRLPEVHLRCLRGAAAQDRGSAGVLRTDNVFWILMEANFAALQKPGTSA